MGNPLKITDSIGIFSKLIIVIFALLGLLRLPRLPLFMDIYYHLPTAWGFLQAGGFSSWDFWEYAPLGRPHIYPPFFHLLLALLMKLGFSVIFLAKFFESVTPVILLLVIWNFIRKNYDEQLGFFVVVAFCSSFTFFTFLANHVPVSLALILGFLSLGELFKKRILRAVILFSLCFYTHISVCWFFFFSYCCYAILDKDRRWDLFRVVFYSFLVALPILFFELLNLHFIHLIGNDFLWEFFLQVKVIDYILAGLGLYWVVKMAPGYRLFISLFLASFIYLSYLYRFITAEGYLPIVFLSALTLQGIWQRIKAAKLWAKKALMGVLILFVLLISPTVILEKLPVSNKINTKIDWVDSVFSGIFLVKGDSIWYPRLYLPAVDILKENSAKDDIVYSGINFSGVIMSALAQRATANAIFPEVRPAVELDPLAVANIILLPKDLEEQFISSLILKYQLAKIRESEYFLIFRNPVPVYRLKIVKAVLSFPVIVSIFFLLGGLFWSEQLMKMFKKSKK